MSTCILCGHKVSGGGDRHAKDSCPQRPPNSRQRARGSLPKAAEYSEAPVRGKPIANTGKSKKGGYV